MADQWQFDFCNWEDAFKTFYRLRCGEDIYADDGRKLGRRYGNDALVFVISTAPIVSGYWIEEGAEPDADTKVYRTVKAVKALEKRLRRARETKQRGALSMGAVIT